MSRCKRCGVTIDSYQLQHHNGLCSACIRVASSSQPLRTLADSELQNKRMFGTFLMIASTFIIGMGFLIGIFVPGFNDSFFAGLRILWVIIGFIGIIIGYFVYNTGIQN